MCFVTKDRGNIKFIGSMVTIIAMPNKLEFFVNNIIVSSMIEVLKSGFKVLSVTLL